MPSTAPIVYETVSSPSQARGTLFANYQIWISARCPSRQHFVNLVKNNGGTVVMSEKAADYCIVDHMRKDTIPGGISYKFLEQSVRDGKLAELEEYVTGPAKGVTRDIGSLQPTKKSRTPYSANDDRILYEWVKPLADGGSAVSGNEIYKQLEKKHPHHTWQSWRDRYVKILQFKRPSTVVDANPPPSPPVEPQTDDGDAQLQLTNVDLQQRSETRISERAPGHRRMEVAKDVVADTHEEEENKSEEDTLTNINSDHTSKAAPTAATSAAPEEDLGSMELTESPDTKVNVPKAARKSAPSKPRPAPSTPEDQFETLFNKEDYMELYTNVKEIRSCTMAEYEDGWDNWAKNTPQSGAEWLSFFETKVLPDWKAHGKDGTRDEKHKQYVAELEAIEESHAEPSRTSELQFSQPKVRFQIDDDNDALESTEESLSTSSRKRTRTGADEEEVSNTAKRPKVHADDEGDAASNGNTSVVAIEISDVENSSDVENDVEPPSQSASNGALNDASQSEIPETASSAAENADSPYAVTNEEVVTQDPESSQPDIDMEVPEPVIEDDDDDDGPSRGDPMDPSYWEGDDESTPRANRYDTQAILETQTQDIDLDIPDPPSDSEAEDEDLNANEEDSRSHRASSILSHTSTATSSSFSPPLTGAEVNSFYRQMGIRGFDLDTIQHILLSTSNYHKESMAVADEFEAGRGLPNDWKGVWTADDDRDLDSADARASVRLERKHGTGRVEERREFVRHLRRGGWAIVDERWTF